MYEELLVEHFREERKRRERLLELYETRVSTRGWSDYFEIALRSEVGDHNTWFLHGLPP